ncbi:MAG: hypothetical protein HC844_19295 [Tabrizicola sp.]|nr:hypothetical protein [Tabrizicola sp.]
MYPLNPVDELVEIRAQIARLKRRETMLLAQIAEDDTGAPRARPGWPIQRDPATNLPV